MAPTHYAYKTPIVVREDGAYVTCIQCGRERPEKLFIRKQKPSRTCHDCKIPEHRYVRPTEVRDGVAHLRCSKCHDWLPEERFNRSGPGTRRYYCKGCDKIRNKEIRHLAIQQAIDVEVYGITKRGFVVGGAGNRFETCENYDLCVDSAARQKNGDSGMRCRGSRPGEQMCRWFKPGPKPEIETYRGQDDSAWPEGW